MYGWLIVNGFLHTEKFDELTQMFEIAAKGRKIHLQVIENNQLPAGYPLSGFLRPDFVIFWDKDILLARYLEQQGICVFNSSDFIEICDDKRKTCFELLKNDIPLPKTIVAPMTYDSTFSSLDFVTPIIKELGFPMIVKEAYGSFGKQVYKADNECQLYELLAKISTTEILFQEYIKTSEGRDVRLQVVGDKVVAAMYRHSENDFRANITAGGEMASYDAGEEAVELAIKTVHCLKGDFAGVDLLFTKDGFCVCEVNSNAHFKNLYDCTGVNTAEHILDYVMRKTSEKRHTRPNPRHV